MCTPYGSSVARERDEQAAVAQLLGRTITRHRMRCQIDKQRTRGRRNWRRHGHRSSMHSLNRVPHVGHVIQRRLRKRLSVLQGFFVPSGTCLIRGQKASRSVALIEISKIRRTGQNVVMRVERIVAEPQSPPVLPPGRRHELHESHGPRRGCRRLAVHRLTPRALRADHGVDPIRRQPKSVGRLANEWLPTCRATEHRAVGGKHAAVNADETGQHPSSEPGSAPHRQVQSGMARRTMAFRVTGPKYRLS